ncbi:MAG: AsmA family protein, partial [Xanthobacteraceae bacterium]
MQTTLLGLAIAIILAIVTALAAPLVIDWNRYRIPIEAEASRLTGLRVRVNGAIEARLLPTPVITVHDVAAGETGQKPQLRAGMLRLELALGALLRGKVEATEVHLVAPQISVGLDRSGAFEWPMPFSSGRPEEVPAAHVSIEDGSVILTDAASGARLAVQKLWFDGAGGGFAGPLAGNGTAFVGDERYDYRISATPLRPGSARMSLAIDPSDIPLTTQFDGVLTFQRGVPQFDGTLALERPVGAALANGRRVISAPWRLSGAIKATPTAAALRNLAFRYGPQERAVHLSGSADVSFGARPRLVGKISAAQIDVDRALAAPDVTGRPPLIVLRNFLPAFLTLTKLPLSARIALSVDALTLGGTTLDSLAGDLQFDRSGWSLKGLHFHAPGLTEVTLSGRLSGTARDFTFTGPATLASADAGALLSWLDGQSRQRNAGEARTFNAHGEMTIASDRVSVDGLTATLGRESLQGRLAYQWPLAHRPSRLDVELRAVELDVDALASLGRSVLGDSFAPPQEARLTLDIGTARYAGVAARAVNARIAFDAGKLRVDRLSVGDLAGAKLDISGAIEELSSHPRGQMILDLDASALDGLSDIVTKLAPREAAAVRRLADRLAPAKVHAVLDVGQAGAAGSTAELRVNGTLAAMRVAIDGKASGEAAHLDSAVVQLDSRIDADDATALVALLGLDRVLAVDQLPGRLTLTAAGPLSGDVHVDGKVETSGFGSQLAGTVRLAGTAAPSAQLQLEAAAGDLRPLQQALTGQPGSGLAVSGHAALAFDGGKLSFTDIAATVGASSVHGRVAVHWANPVVVEGDIAASEADVGSLAALLFGLPRDAHGAAAQWSQAPIGAGAFASIDGAVAFKFARANLAPTLAVDDLAAVAHFHSSAISVDNIDGRFAGGRVTGALALQRNPDGLAVHAAFDLGDVAAAEVLGPALNVSGGRLTVSLASDGFGTSPAALIGSLHGSGTVILKDAQFAGLDAGVFAAAMRAAGRGSPIEMGKVQAAVNASLASGHLTVPLGEATLSVASGAVDLNPVTLQAAAGGAQLAIGGAVDLGHATINGRMTLSEAPPVDALIAIRPELSVNVHGPLAAPQRTLDMAALQSWLTLSAAELQTRLIDSIEANRRTGMAGQAGHAGSPNLPIAPSGAVVESAIPQRLLSAPVPGPRGLERLQ